MQTISFSAKGEICPKLIDLKVMLNIVLVDLNENTENVEWMEKMLKNAKRDINEIQKIMKKDAKIRGYVTGTSKAQGHSQDYPNGNWCK